MTEEEGNDSEILEATERLADSNKRLADSQKNIFLLKDDAMRIHLEAHGSDSVQDLAQLTARTFLFILEERKTRGSKSTPSGVG